MHSSIFVQSGGCLHGPHPHPMAPAGEALPATRRTSSVDLFPWVQKLSCRKEIPASRCARGGKPPFPSPDRARSYAMSDVFPFSASLFLANELRGSGPTNSGPVHVAQKPFSSSASRVLTWINATSIGICNARFSTRPHGHASRKRAHPPTPASSFP